MPLCTMPILRKPKYLASSPVPSCFAHAFATLIFLTALFLDPNSARRHSRARRWSAQSSDTAKFHRHVFTTRTALTLIFRTATSLMYEWKAAICQARASQRQHSSGGPISDSFPVAATRTMNAIAWDLLVHLPWCL